jgi:hypothetical protein
MATKKQTKPKAKPKKASPKKKKTAEKLPFCTTAPSAEHHRARNEDGPCDDGRESRRR